MRDFIMNEIRYWNKWQPAHTQEFYERRAPPGMKKFRITKEWIEQYWSELSDEEMVKQFSYFMMHQGKMR